MTNVTLSVDELTPKDLAFLQEEAYLRDVARLQKKIDQFVSVKCPACDGVARVPQFKKYGFSFERCTSCQTIYMNPRPTKEIMEEYYLGSENYTFYSKYIFPATESVRREKIQRPWLQRVLDCPGGQGKKGALLEVGPGFGTFAALAKESCIYKDVIVVEPTPDLAKVCVDKGLNVYNKPIENLEIQELQCNISTIVAFEVIEHLFDPRQFIKKCRTILDDDGVLVLSCPNGMGFDIQMLGSKSIAVDTEHVNLFNPKSLTYALMQEGFEILSVSTPGKLDAEYVRQSYLNGEVELDVFLRNVLIDGWESYGEIFQNFLIRNNMSSHMWIIAVKK